MSLGAWQIVVTLIGIAAAPWLAAKLAVRNLQVERDHDRLDELRVVLDELAAQFAVCEGAARAAVGAVAAGAADNPDGRLDVYTYPMVIRLGRQIVGPSERTLRDIRERYPPPPETFKIDELSSATRSMKILNWITEHELDRLKRCGWIERQREPRPDERRILLTLWHPRQTIGEGNDRHQTAVQTLRSLPLGRPLLLGLFDGLSWTLVPQELHLVPEQRLEGRRAGTHARAPLRAVDAAGRKQHGARGEGRWHKRAVGPVRDSVVNDPFAVEPEAERNDRGSSSNRAPGRRESSVSRRSGRRRRGSERSGPP